jgi:hypothetical protein
VRAAPVEEGVRRHRWTEHYEARIERGERRHGNRAGVGGLDLVMRIGGGREIAFQGRKYGVPPVPWDVAPLVLAAQERWSAMDAEPSSPEWPALYRDVARLFKLICFPTSRLRRWLWRFTPSPLRRASHLEVARALGFFSTFRRLDRGESPQAILADLLQSGTWPSSSHGSALASPHGATNGASR